MSFAFYVQAILLSHTKTKRGPAPPPPPPPKFAGGGGGREENILGGAAARVRHGHDVAKAAREPEGFREETAPHPFSNFGRSVSEPLGILRVSEGIAHT